MRREEREKKCEDKVQQSATTEENHWQSRVTHTKGEIATNHLRRYIIRAGFFFPV